MTTSTKKQQLYGEYINPTIDQNSPKKENPLVLMAQACNNIGKELPTSISSSPLLPSFISKQRKSTSPQETKKSFKRSAPTTSLSPPAKKIPNPSSSLYPTNQQQSFYLPPSPFLFDSLLLHHLNKTFSSTTFDFPSPLSYSSNSVLSPSSQRSPYFMDSILSSPSFVCNWMDSNISDGFCGKRFSNHIHLLEHLCTEHTSIKSLNPSYYSSTSVGKL